MYFQIKDSSSRVSAVRYDQITLKKETPPKEEEPPTVEHTFTVHPEISDGVPWGRYLKCMTGLSIGKGITIWKIIRTGSLKVITRPRFLASILIEHTLCSFKAAGFKFDPPPQNRAAKSCMPQAGLYHSCRDIEYFYRQNPEVLDDIRNGPPGSGDAGRVTCLYIAAKYGLRSDFSRENQCYYGP